MKRKISREFGQFFVALNAYAPQKHVVRGGEIIRCGYIINGMGGISGILESKVCGRSETFRAPRIVTHGKRGGCVRHGRRVRCGGWGRGRGCGHPRKIPPPPPCPHQQHEDHGGTSPLWQLPGKEKYEYDYGTPMSHPLGDDEAGNGVQGRIH